MEATEAPDAAPESDSAAPEQEDAEEFFEAVTQSVLTALKLTAEQLHNLKQLNGLNEAAMIETTTRFNDECHRLSDMLHKRIDEMHTFDSMSANVYIERMKLENTEELLDAHHRLSNAKKQLKEDS